MSASTISYKNLFNNLTTKQENLAKKHNFIIAETSWYWEALSILNQLITAIEKNQKLKNENNDDNYWNKIFTALSLLFELSGILDVTDSLNNENIKIFLSRLKLAFKGPLLMSDEDTDSNLGRNTLFELKIFSKLVTNGYKAQLHYDHPDISFQIDEKEYVIECKRIYKPETLVSNTHVALEQLRKYSLNQPKPSGVYARYGIVAISLSRYIHQGDKLFDAGSQEAAKKRINYEMNKIFEENKEELLRPFPVNVPALLFEYSDRGSIDMPYTFNFIDVYETANGRYSNFKYVVSDLNKLID